MSTRVRSWTPISGEQATRLITHHEAIEIADYLTLYDNNPPAFELPSGQQKQPGGVSGAAAASAECTAGRSVLYRPTVHYAYRPCDDAELSLDEVEARGYCLPEKQRIMMQQDIAPGE
jgi:homospermidine synthase